MPSRLSGAAILFLFCSNAFWNGSRIASSQYVSSANKAWPLPKSWQMLSVELERCRVVGLYLAQLPPRAQDVLHAEQVDQNI
jgi:hypothetical protein